MRRALKYIAAALLLLVVLLAAGITYLISTTPGAASLLNIVAARSGMVLQWETLEGTLLDGIDARNVSGSSGGSTWNVAQLHLRWQPASLRGRLLLIDELSASDVEIRSQASAPSNEPFTAEDLQSMLFTLPVAIDIRQLQISNFSFVQGETNVAIDNVAAALRLDNERLVISSLQYGAEGVTVSGDVQLQQTLALAGDIAWQLQQDADVYAGTLGLSGTLQQIGVSHALSQPVQLNSNGTLQPALFTNDVLGFDLQHEFPPQSLAVLQRPEMNFGGSIHTTGSATGGSFDTSIQLNGMVQDYPVLLDGRLTRRPTGTLDIDIDGSSGSNMLSVLGSIGDVLELQWNVQAPALQQLLPTLSGALNGEGTLRGTRELPEVSGTLNGAQLAYEMDGTTYAVDTLAFTANYSAAGNDLQLQLGTLTQRDAGNAATLLESATVTLAGTPAQHTATASIDAAQGDLQLALRGAYVDDSWNGTLASSSLRSPQYGNWELDEPVTLRYAPDAIDVSRHCWNQQQLVLCLAATMDAERRVDAELTLDALPLAWLNADKTVAGKPAALQQLQDEAGIYLPEDLSIIGSVDLAMAMQDFRGLNEGTVDLTLNPSGIELQWQPQDAEQQDELLSQHLALTVNRSEVHLRQGSWSGNLDVDVAREQQGQWLPQGNIRGEGGLDAADALDATVAFDFRDLSWVETAVPLLRGTQGTIDGLATVAGTRSDPRLQLQMQLSQAQFDVPEYGLEIRNMGLSLTTEADESLEISGSAESGGGLLNLDARVEMPLRPERKVTAQLMSDNVLVINTAAAKSLLNSDLRLEYSQSGIAINGGVEMLDADFDLEALFRRASEGAVEVSSDVVIVRGAPEDLEAQANSVASIPLTLDMTVKAGEGVHVHGYDLDASLAGELSLRQTPGQSLLVYGELGIPLGSYSIYNQQLNAEDGRLMFFGNPANPVLDLRAFRKTESAEVGVWLNGALSEVRGELYSTPALPDSEILSLLVTGKSFGATNSQESDALLDAVANFGLGRSGGITSRVGNTLGLDSLTLGGDSVQDSALGLGKYLTPNLLMRYKVGLFDRQSVLGIEYTLNEHVKLKVESGISQSLEISYTIEKD